MPFKERAGGRSEHHLVSQLIKNHLRLMKDLGAIPLLRVAHRYTITVTVTMFACYDTHSFRNRSLDIGLYCIRMHQVNAIIWKATTFSQDTVMYAKFMNKTCILKYTILLLDKSYLFRTKTMFGFSVVRRDNPPNLHTKQAPILTGLGGRRDLS